MSAGVRMSRSDAVDAEGLAALERAVELDDGHLAARVRLGRAYTDQNRYLKTLEQFQAVAEAEPGYPEIHSYLAVLYLKMGRVIQAIRELQTEVELYPDNAMARLDLGDLLLQLAQPRLALRHLTAAERESPETPTFTMPWPEPTGPWASSGRPWLRPASASTWPRRRWLPATCWPSSIAATVNPIWLAGNWRPRNG